MLPELKQRASRLYVKMEHRHVDEMQRLRLEFQGIDADWFDQSHLQELQRSLAAFYGARVYLLQIDPQQIDRALREESEASERDDPAVAGVAVRLLGIENDLDPRWFEIRFAPDHKKVGGSVRARVFGDMGPENWTQRIAYFDRVDVETQRRLDSVFRLPRTPEAQIKQVLTSRSWVDPHVVAYDVGQGGANGLHHPRGWAECYFDLGGGVCDHAATYPTDIRFCFSKTPLVILSHWHFDHWVSATFDARALESHWIVPEQTIGPFHLALTLAIWDAGGRVIVWPASWRGVLDIGPIAIGLCSGSDRNESGLAVLVRTYSGNVLLPGDCGYEHLPDFWPGSTGAPRLQGLVAPHHGGITSALRTRSIPGPASAWSKLAYSYGKPNTYGHPRDLVTADHVGAGWTPAMTRESHVLRPRQGHVWLTPTPFVPPCNLGYSGRVCTLCPAQ